MPNAYVTSVKFEDDQLTFRVDLGDYGSIGGSIEISGQATQSGGAFAIISAIKKVPTAPNGDKGEYYVDVKATPISPNKFNKNQDVTVFARVSRVWVTVLKEHNAPQGEESPGQPADPGTTWDQLVTVSQLNGEPPPSPW